MINLDVRVETLKGVGVAMAIKLERLGILTVGDLINHYPRRYVDFSQIIPIRSMKPGLVTFKGSVERIASRRVRGRKLQLTEAIISDGTGTVKAIWFNQSFLATQYPAGTEVFVAGKVEFRNSDLALQSPAIEKAEVGNRHTGRIVPVYPETEGLSSRQLRNIIAPLLSRLDGLPETLPDSIMAEAKLMSRSQALAEIHTPTTASSLQRARHRMAFEELFYIIGASLTIRKETKTESAQPISLKVEVAQAFTKALDFELTNAQRAAAWQILQDMQDVTPMNRLLEGDVGSGKTVVALLAAVMVMASGHQAVLMVPTDILARQHAATIEPLLAKLGYSTSLVLARHPASMKQAAETAIKRGSAQFVIGTHALLSERIQFARLGLVIVDEQHRFGVEQRQLLKKKAGRLPHLLSMTATPIPRSLALTVYGDLDISLIDGLPPHRQPIATRILKPQDRTAAYGFIDTEIAKGRQAFVVCPLIEDSDTLGTKSVTAEAERLQAGAFKHRRIGVVHGKQKPGERDEVMRLLVEGNLDILVATSVIEVGIDIPNASIMLIEGAERFGLAALHQLRGRVGRGEHHSYCFIASDSSAPGVMQRLQALERTNDGFRLAQIDLELRGPGQVYGRRQHGMLELQMADLGDTRLIAAVRKAAERFVGDPEAMLQYPQVMARVNRLKSLTSLD